MHEYWHVVQSCYSRVQVTRADHPARKSGRKGRLNQRWLAALIRFWRRLGGLAVQLHRFSRNRPTNDCRQNPISAPVSPTPLPSRAARPVQARALRPFNPGAHHGDQETHREEGCEGEAPGQDRREEVRQGSEGARPVTLTRFQIHERLGSLSGEVKAAHEHKRLTAETLAHQEREVTLARQADEKAEAQIVRLEQEALDLAAAYGESVKELIGITPGAAEQVPAEPIITEEFLRDAGLTQNEQGAWGSGSAAVKHHADFADFGHPTQNGLDDSAVTAAFDRSTHP